MDEIKPETDPAQLLEHARSEVVVGAHYRHFKGLQYHVISVGLREETLEPCVAYQADYGDQLVWIRPISSWCAEVEIAGKKVPRFSLIHGAD